MSETLAPASARARVLVILVATLLMVALTARLGVWQLDRAAQKATQQAMRDAVAGLPPLGAAELATAEADAAAQWHRPVVLRGLWLESHTVFLDNRQMNGRPGFFVLTPLQPSGNGPPVLVQRGWIPRHSIERTRIAPFVTPSQEVTVRGHIAPPPARLYEFAQAGEGAIRQNIDLDDFARETGLRLVPLTVLQDATPQNAGDGLLREWSPPASGIHKHYGYAFQWFALSALTAGLYVWFQLVTRWRRRRRA